ncbi:MAG: VWA domain-containing protein [Planctomycetaceae bacterium]|nr:VWA domain-containing protein [Planctomycetales bacterium]MCB9921781.1 VWA domain-containing protein [Planctomycetaceae bacterium]
MSELRLAEPMWLLMTVPLVVVTLLSLRGERRGAVVYSSVRLLETLPITFAQRLKRLLPALRCAGMLLMIIALARPQHGLKDFRIQTEGISIVMCIDRSGSMQALDFQLDGKRVDRLEAVKSVFHNFVAGDGNLPGRPDDQIGLVSFGGFAEAKAPLTLDHGALLDVLKAVQIAEPVYDREGNVINRRYLEEERATAIGDAVALAVERLRDSQAKSKVIILLSDGENTAGAIEPEDAAKAAASFGITIYSIGVGTTGSAPFKMIDPFGREQLVRQPVRLDEAALKSLAEATQGRYFNAKSTNALEDVYSDIDRLEKTELEGRLYTEYRELFQWWLLPGITLIVIELTLRCTRYRSLP